MRSEDLAVTTTDTHSQGATGMCQLVLLTLPVLSLTGQSDLAAGQQPRTVVRGETGSPLLSERVVTVLIWPRKPRLESLK